MNQSYVQPVPYNATCTEWVDVNHVADAGGAVVPLRYAYSPERKRYEWAETGPLLRHEGGVSEASIARGDGVWVILARRSQGRVGAAWFRAQDPFKAVSAAVVPASPAFQHSPLSVYRGPDGALRVFGNDDTLNDPPRGRRDPLRCWQIDPGAGFSASHHRVVLDSRDYLPKRHPPNSGWQPALDMPKLLPHGGGREQYLVHRCHVGAGEIKDGGVVYEKVVYWREYPAAWAFE
jgi:hypothetical protein